MTIKLFAEAITKMLLGVVIVGMLIFLPAGMFFRNGLLLMTILFLPMLVAGIIMMFKSPHLLKKRLNAKEEQNEQKIIVAVSGFVFVFGFVVAGLTVRFNWYTFPEDVSDFFMVVFLIGYVLYGEVIRENKYLSRTVEIQKGQEVVDKGLYGVVRHPMYCATLIMFLSMPVILGSIYAFAIFLAYPFIIFKRIKSEEELLKRELNGYMQYMEKVKYRLIPFVW